MKKIVIGFFYLIPKENMKVIYRIVDIRQRLYHKYDWTILIPIKEIMNVNGHIHINDRHWAIRINFNVCLFEILFF